MLPAPRLPSRRQRLLLFALLALGLGLRGYHYLRDRAVWQDEAGLLLTVTARGFGDLFSGRLDYHQAAPPLYLCVLKSVSLVLGDSSHALRLPSFLASCIALLLFLAVARRWLAAQAVPWAMLLFACSEQLLWHASEAKAYSVDVLASVVVLAVPCCGRFGSLQRQLMVYTLLTPLLLLSSYPACFLCAGVLLAYLPAVYSRKQLPIWLAYGALAATIGTIFLWLVYGPVRCQHDAEIHSCWVACMPNWERPWTVPGWLFLSSLEVCRYSCKPLGQVLAVFALPGTLVLWRAGERTRLRLMLAPIILTVAAACAHRYPFGGARVMAYSIPAILLLAAAGVPSVFAWLRGATKQADADFSSPLSPAGRGVGGERKRRPSPPTPLPSGERGAKAQVGLRQSVFFGLAFLLLVPLFSSLEQIFHPWREADVPSAADYVLAQCQTEDLILGNDVAQQYYFRHLGPLFHLLDESPLPSPPGNRVWVVMTAALPWDERVRLASHLAPAGWHACRQREFAFTTVILFSR